MKHLRKSILTLLALTLFGGAGAWAQTVFTTLQVGDVIHVGDQFNPTDLCIITQNGNYLVACIPGGNTPLTLVRANITQGVTESATGAYFLFRGNAGNYFFNDANNSIAATENSDGLVVTELGTNSGFPLVTLAVHEAAAQAIELTKAGANQWSLGQTPDYDLELQVEYYEAHALKDIPAGWTVLVNGEPQTQPYEGDSLMITETDSVTLVPAGNPRRVKSVTLEDEGPAVQTVTIGNVTLQVVEGETWQQIAQRNPGVITADDYADGFVYRDLDTVLRAGTAYIKPTDTYNSSLDYYWYEY